MDNPANAQEMKGCEAKLLDSFQAMARKELFLTHRLGRWRSKVELSIFDPNDFLLDEAILHEEKKHVQTQ